MEPTNDATTETRTERGADAVPNQQGSMWKWLAGIGLGAAAMYFLDPDRGGRRRAMVRDQAASLLKRASREARDRADDVRNRVKGTAHELTHRGADVPTDDVLVARVRAELGHRVEHPRTIEVVADQGTVTLRGAVLRDELDDVMSTVRKVRGVREVNNEMRVSEGETSGGAFEG